MFSLFAKTKGKPTIRTYADFPLLVAAETKLAELRTRANGLNTEKSEIHNRATASAPVALEDGSMRQWNPGRFLVDAAAEKLLNEGVYEDVGGVLTERIKAIETELAVVERAIAVQAAIVRDLKREAAISIGKEVEPIYKSALQKVSDCLHEAFTAQVELRSLYDELQRHDIQPTGIIEVGLVNPADAFTKESPQLARGDEHAPFDPYEVSVLNVWKRSLRDQGIELK